MTTPLLMKRWTMELADHLHWQKDVDQREATEAAHAACNLLQALGAGIVTFCYRKTDGTIRYATGTLNPDCEKRLAAWLDSHVTGSYPHRGNENTEGVYTYWDTEAGGWRSFRAERLEYIKDCRDRYGRYVLPEMQAMENAFNDFLNFNEP